MRIDILFPVLPPKIDGIGDHTALLAGALESRAHVRILCAQETHDPIEGVDVVHAFSLTKRRDILRIADVIERDTPDWLFIQFNQFSYGRWGLNPFLPLAIAQIRRRCPNTRIAWMAHEDFVPVTNWRFAVMTIWQRAQFKALGQMADHIFFSIEPWAEKYQAWFPRKPVTHLPVGSNIPHVGPSRYEARRRLDIPEATLVIGVFGTMGRSRLPGHITRAVEALVQSDHDVLLLYVGPDGHKLRQALPQAQLHDAGTLPAEIVSMHLKAMDLHLAPYSDGVSTRRGSFLAGLQHGVSSVTTIGKHTDSLLKAEANDAYRVCDVADIDGFVAAVQELGHDAVQRQALGDAGMRFYQEHFTFDQTADKLVNALLATSPPSVI